MDGGPTDETGSTASSKCYRQNGGHEGRPAAATDGEVRDLCRPLAPGDGLRPAVRWWCDLVEREDRGVDSAMTTDKPDEFTCLKCGVEARDAN